MKNKTLRLELYSEYLIMMNFYYYLLQVGRLTTSDCLNHKKNLDEWLRTAIKQMRDLHGPERQQFLQRRSLVASLAFTLVPALIHLIKLSNLSLICQVHFLLSASIASGIAEPRDLLRSMGIFQHCFCQQGGSKIPIYLVLNLIQLTRQSKTFSVP